MRKIPILAWILALTPALAGCGAKISREELGQFASPSDVQGGGKPFDFGDNLTRRADDPPPLDAPADGAPASAPPAASGATPGAPAGGPPGGPQGSPEQKSPAAAPESPHAPMGTAGAKSSGQP